MREVAGVLIHDAQLPRDPIGPRSHKLGRIAHARREGPTAQRPRGILVEHVAVRFQVRAAARRVHHDGKVTARERIDVETRELACLLAVTGVRVQRAAAELLDRRGHAAPVALEHPHGRALGLAERLAHHASGEESDVGIVVLGERERRALGTRREGTEPRESAWADPARQRGQPGTPSEIRQLRHERQTSTVRDGVEAEPSDRPLDAALGTPLGEHFTRALHDPPERHAGRARGLARAAHQARIEMAGERRARRRGRGHELADELDATARRVRLLAEDAVGGAIVEAQPARDAGGEILGADVRGERIDRP